MKNLSRITASLIIGVLLYGSYKSYWFQREEYRKNLVVRLQGVCSKLIQNYFGEHASLFDIRETEDNVFVGTQDNFTINNDILSLRVEGRSFLYFQDYAPQEVTCTASLPYKVRKKGITANTHVEINIIGPNYLPSTYKNNQMTFTLTMQKLEKQIPFATFFPLEKPKYGVVNFYLKKLTTN